MCPGRPAPDWVLPEHLVVAVEREQSVVRALLDDATLVEHHQPVPCE